MAEATLTLTRQGLYVITHDGVEYEGTPNDAVAGALLWLLEPEHLNLRGSDADNLRALREAHSNALRLAYAITASLAPILPSPIGRQALQALLLNACSLSPASHQERLMRKTADALAPGRRH